MQELELAWQLAGLADGELGDVERHHVYVALGAGDAITAIALLLNAMVNRQLVVGAELVARLRRWVDAYCGHPFEPVIRKLIGEAEGIAVGSTPAAAAAAASAVLKTQRRYRPPRNLRPPT